MAEFVSRRHYVFSPGGYARALRSTGGIPCAAVIEAQNCEPGLLELFGEDAVQAVCQQCLGPHRITKQNGRTARSQSPRLVQGSEQPAIADTKIVEFRGYGAFLTRDARLSDTMVIEGIAMFNLFPERVLALGHEGGLIAIATDPVPPIASKPAVIMLNAGVLHRVGPRRLHVLLGRELAARGYTTCRVDLSGIGDSRAITGNISFRESSVLDTRLVMDHFAREAGANQFVLFGLCSGADNALAVAAADPRVAGLVLIDASSYPTLRAHVRKHFRRSIHTGALSVAFAIMAAAARLVANILRRNRPITAAPAGRQPPPKAEFRNLLNNLADRGTKLLLIYTSAMQGSYNHANQIFELFPELRGRVTGEYFGEADHAFTEVAEQRRLINVVVAWLDRSFS